LNCKSVTPVFGSDVGEAIGLENTLRLDTTFGKELTKESSDVSGLGVCEVLEAQDVLVLETRGCGSAWHGELVRTAIIATVLSPAELAGARLLNHSESEVLVVIEVVQDRVVSLGEGFILRGLELSENDGLENIGDIDVAFEEFQHLQSVADIAEVVIDVSLGVAIPGYEEAKFGASRTVCMRLWLRGNAVRRASHT
jgi:hypothetical protein